MANTGGIVYLVGAGPGDTGLITVRGADCLRRADVVVYDNLANSSLLAYVPVAAELIYAGKKAQEHTRTQDEINELLLDRARKGLVVVRLKGGDPFLFGRGGEEAGWLGDHGVAWEVVPGVSSALAVPAYAGIPVTHRVMNGSLHVVTGHESEASTGVEVDWEVLARSRGTIVVLMGVKNLPSISQQLIAHGLDPQTPVAMIRWGTMPEQQTLVSRLDRVADDVAASGMKPPAICVIGDVVNLRQTLAWVEKRPLFGLRIAVTRPAEENDILSTALRDMGAEVVPTPTLQVKALPADDAARSILEGLSAGKFDWLAITSGNGARHLVRMLMEGGTDLRALARCRVAVIGHRTAEALRAVGIAPDMVVEDSTQEGLAAALVAQGARQVVVARARVARQELEQRLGASGARVTVLPLYETVPDPAGISRLVHLLQRDKLTTVTFTSGRTFEALAEGAPGGAEGLPGLLQGCAVAVIGPITRAAVERAGVRVDIESARPDMESLAQAIAQGQEARRR